MRNNRYLSLVGVSVLILWMAGFAVAAPGQTAAPSAPAPAPHVAPVLPVTPVPCDCGMSDEGDAVVPQVEVQELSSKLQGELAVSAGKLAAMEAKMQLQDWGKLDEVSAHLAGLQSELSAEIPEALAQAEKRVIEISPDDDQVWQSDDSGWLGIEISEITGDKAKELNLPAVRGVQVMSVEPDSPAVKAGLKENDVILSYEGQNVEGTVQFRRLVRETPPGRTIPFTVFRDGTTQSLNVEIGNRSAQFEKHIERGMDGDMAPMPPMPPGNFSMPDFNFKFVTPEAMDWHMPLLGISAEDLNGQLGSYFGAPNNEGILVREVKAGTPADKAGLKAGDVIMKIDDQPVKSLHDLRTHLRDKSDQKSVNLSILRKGSEMTIPVAIEKPRPIDAPQIVHRAQL